MEASNNAEYTEMIEARISPFIQRIMHQKRITGLSIALVDEQGVLAAKGFGFADKQNQQPATSHTVYKIGSITKLFTGTAAMQLYERGQLDLDEPVIEYLPEFSIKARPESISQITPRTKTGNIAVSGAMRTKTPTLLVQPFNASTAPG